MYVCMHVCVNMSKTTNTYEKLMCNKHNCRRTFSTNQSSIYNTVCLIKQETQFLQKQKMNNFGHIFDKFLDVIGDSTITNSFVPVSVETITMFRFIILF